MSLHLRFSRWKRLTAVLLGWASLGGAACQSARTSPPPARLIDHPAMLDFSGLANPRYLPELKAYKDSSVAMMRSLGSRGHAIYALRQSDIYWSAKGTRARVVPLALEPDDHDWYREGAAEDRALKDFAAVPQGPPGCERLPPTPVRRPAAAERRALAAGFGDGRPAAESNARWTAAYGPRRRARCITRSGVKAV